MLAQNFMPATDLGITEVEKEALITVLGMLERGEIDDTHFRMTVFSEERECGTVGCLCGWANAVSAGKAFPEIGPNVHDSLALVERLNHNTKALFWLGVNLIRMAAVRATAERGAQVLRAYLQTGKSTWDRVYLD